MGISTKLVVLLRRRRRFYKVLRTDISLFLEFLGLLRGAPKLTMQAVASFSLGIILAESLITAVDYLLFPNYLKPEQMMRKLWPTI